MTPKQNSDAQRADIEQSTPQRITTAREFFREKFADESTDADTNEDGSEYGELGPFIDPKADDIVWVST